MGKIILLNVCLQLFYFIGVIFVIGFLIHFLTSLFYRMVGGSRAAVYISGAIGTPIHELSHAVMCILFGHKIEEMRLFQIDDESGALGYVSHSYTKTNIWALIGNYFIGIAPIVCGSGVLLLAMRFLVPEVNSGVGASLSLFAAELSRDGLSGETFGLIFKMFGGFFRAVFVSAELDVYWWIFIVLSVCIALHMSLSGADIKGALPALPLVILLIGVLNLVIGFIIPSFYESFVGAMNVAGGYLIGMLLLAIFLSLIYIVLALLIKLVFALIGKLFGR